VAGGAVVRTALGPESTPYTFANGVVGDAAEGGGFVVECPKCGWREEPRTRYAATQQARAHICAEGAESRWRHLVFRRTLDSYHAWPEDSLEVVVVPHEAMFAVLDAVYARMPSALRRERGAA